ncbi:MAG: ABC transporter permease [Burkholderiales bacterium]
MIFTLAAKELKALFISPLAWLVLVLFQFILGFSFLKRLDGYMQMQPQLALLPHPPGVTALVVAPTYGTAAVILLFAVPLLAMRMIAEERRNQTMTLLTSSPLTMTTIVLGKFAGLLGFLLIVIALVTLMPVMLTAGGAIDFGLLATLVIGLILTAASFAAVSLFVSSLTTHPVGAAVAAFGVLLAMVLLGEAAVEGLRERGWQAAASMVQVLAPLDNFDSFTHGLIDSYSTVCMILLTLVCLALAIRRLDALRLKG